MQINTEKLPLESVAHFPKLFLDYLEQKEGIEKWYNHFPTLEGFKQQVAEKTFNHRPTLVKVLKEQYAAISNQPNLEVLLDENTFTVTTGHQLNIFTGPLYVIYKIVSTINLAQRLKEYLPQYNFVPVYWMATEDHDFEEIAKFYLFGNTYEWSTEQKGAVGEMNPKELEEVLAQLQDKPELFEKAYLQHDNLADAVRFYMNELFGAKGLVCVDGNHSDLKQIFAPIVKDELLNQNVKRLLDENTLALDELGYRPQINGREINLFYKEKGLRERIEKQDGVFTVVGTDIQFSEKEILKLVDDFPERFSPNVALRPLYEEMILPNVGYLGGPSELTYWLQLKGVFDYYKVAYPIVMPRNLALVISGVVQKKMDKLGISAADLYLDDAQLKKEFVKRNSENTLTFTEEENLFLEAFNGVLEKATAIDASLKGVVEAEKAKFLKTFGNLEGRIKKAEEKKFETSIAQLISIKEKLFPGGSQQERKENFLNYYLNNPDFIEKLFEVFDPLDFRFNVIRL